MKKGYNVEGNYTDCTGTGKHQNKQMRDDVGTVNICGGDVLPSHSKKD